MMVSWQKKKMFTLKVTDPYALTASVQEVRGDSGLPVKTTHAMPAMKEYILVFEGMLANVHSNIVSLLHHRSNVL